MCRRGLIDGDGAEGIRGSKCDECQQCRHCVGVGVCGCWNKDSKAEKSWSSAGTCVCVGCSAVRSCAVE